MAKSKYRKITRAAEDRPALVYRHKSDQERERMTVYQGTGAHDALRTDPDWELVRGREAELDVAPKTGKVGQKLHEVLGLSEEELRQVAAQAGVSNDLDELSELDRQAIIDELARRDRVDGDDADDDDDGGDGDGTGDGDDGGESVELEALTRPQLNAKAKEAGVDAPDKLANKGEVIAAIKAKQA